VNGSAHFERGPGPVSAPGRLRSPLIYFGGKQTLAPRIARLLPEHGHYVEPFAGALGVLLAKPVSGHETVNDLDGDLMCFWRVLREQPDQLARLCALTPHSREEHQLAYHRPGGLAELERARRVWVCLTQGRGATLLPTGWRHYVAPRGTTGMPDYLAGYVGRMAGVARRLAGVSLECRPAVEVIERYGAHPGVLIYADPPYLGAARGPEGGSGERTRRYRHELLGAGEHRELVEQLRDCAAAVVLSGYPSALYDEFLTDWDRVEFTTGTGQNARGLWSQRTEVLWSNRPLRPLAETHADLFTVTGSPPASPTHQLRAEVTR